MDINDYCGYIYIIQLREYILSNESVFKIGITRKIDPTNRFAHYPKKSKVIFVGSVTKHLLDKKKSIFELENEMKYKCAVMFIRRKDIGNEYFEGKIESIVSLMQKIEDIEILDFKYENETNKFIIDKDFLIDEQNYRENYVLNINKHILGIGRYECHKCGFVFTEKTNLRRHIRKIICQKTEEHVNELIKTNWEVDIEQMKNDKKCHKCGKDFTEKTNLRRHIRNNKCQKTEELISKLKENIIKQPVMYSCEKCGTQYKSIQAYNKHIAHPNQKCLNIQKFIENKVKEAIKNN